MTIHQSSTRLEEDQDVNGGCTFFSVSVSTMITLAGSRRLLQLLPTRDRLPHNGEYARRQEDCAAHKYCTSPASPLTLDTHKN